MQYFGKEPTWGSKMLVNREEQEPLSLSAQSGALDVAAGSQPLSSLDGSGCSAPPSFNCLNRRLDPFA